MNTMLDIGEVRVTGGVPKDVLKLLTETKPIPGLS